MSQFDLLIQLESTKPFFSHSENKIYDYILENLDKVPNMAISELSLNIGVSEATIIRFTRKVGFKGYSEFKMAITSQLSQRENQEVLITEMNIDDSPLSIYEKLSNFTISSIQNTTASLNDDQFIKAVDLIEETYLSQNRIFLVGAGASSVLVKQMQIKLMRLNIDTIYFEDAHLQLESITSIREKDLLICFTTLGKSVQTQHSIEIANKRKAKIIMITQFGNQSLVEKVDVSIYISSVESNLRLASQTALIVQSLIIDTIFLALALRNLDEIKEDVDHTKEIFDKYNYYNKI